MGCHSGIRYVNKAGEKKFVHTCNGTAVASTRTLISIFGDFPNGSEKCLEISQCDQEPMRLATRLIEVPTQHKPLA
ncbi:hypothetical protein OSTOST_11512 [Ostertagia ostertagi]